MSDKYITEKEATATWVAHGGDKDPVGYVTTGRSGLLKYHCPGYYISAEGILGKTLSTSTTFETYEVDGKSTILRSEFEEALVTLDKMQVLAKEEEKRQKEQLAKETPEERAAYVTATKQLEEMMKSVTATNRLQLPLLERARETLTLSLRAGREKISELTTCLCDRSEALQTLLRNLMMTLEVSNENNVYKYREEKEALKTATTECTKKLDSMRKLWTRVRVVERCAEALDDELTAICSED